VNEEVLALLVFGDGGAEIISPVLKENVIELELEALNEEIDLSLQTRENDTKL